MNDSDPTAGASQPGPEQHQQPPTTPSIPTASNSGEGNGLTSAGGPAATIGTTSQAPANRLGHGSGRFAALLAGPAERLPNGKAAALSWIGEMIFGIIRMLIVNKGFFHPTGTL